jgi:PmbA protein
MNFKAFFALAESKGIAQSQIQISRSDSLSIKLFHKEIDNYKVADSQSITACGIYNGRFGFGTTQKLNADTFAFLVDQIILTASTSEKEQGAEIFKGSEKYHKKNVFNPELGQISVEEKIALLHQVEDAIFAYDPRINEVEEVDYSEKEIASEFYNSFGLKLKQKSNYFYFAAGAVAKQGEEVKTDFEIFLDSDLHKFDPKAFADKIAKKALAKFGGTQCLSGQYPAVLHSDIVASLVEYYLQSASSDEVQRKSSFLIGKLGQKIASSKLTIEEKPLTKNVFFSYFDDEGVATYNKAIIKKGVLQTYFYNRETAKKDGVQSTGNGAWEGAKIGVGFSNIFVKPGKASFDELIAPIKEGVYITEIAGLGTGMNEQSGDFSCQAQGFMIRDGKIAEPLNLITLSGNLLKMFADLKGFDNQVELKDSALTCADAYIKAMAIGGK